ncbi:MAG: glycosyltransferase, partial [Rhizobiales bacterium]|nr:glycosyltransferase [Hyphomicrobiales bacterium]
NRIARYLGRDSIVVFPPVDIDRFGWQGQDGYYLSTARLSPLKRVDRIVDAFLKLPDKNLVVVSGGQDLDELKRRAAGAPNITFRGWVSDAELRTLVGKAIATIYLPRDEDFGMSPVESMAAGKPVIGVAEGGLLETVIPHQTGILLAPNFSEADLVAAVDAMTREKALSLREACEIRARDFSRDRFVAGMHSVISGALQEAGL